MTVELECDAAVPLPGMKKKSVLAVEMEAGGALFFNFFIPHCTKANRTENERAGLAFHFLCTDFEDSLVTSPDVVKLYLPGPHYSGGEAEYGKNLESEWESLVSARA